MNAMPPATRGAPSPTGPRGPAGRRVPAEAIDLLVVAIVIAAYCISAADGFRWEFGGVRVSISTPTRVLLAAAALVIVRRWRWPRAPLHPWVGRPVSWIRARFEPGPSPSSPGAPTPSEWAGVGALFLALTGVMLRRQLAAPYGVPDLGDPLFSIWRLSWVAHQLPIAPLHLFDGNMFYPELRTLAYSDAMLATSLIAAPFLWLGVPQVLVYNALLVLSFPASGLAAYALVRRLTGDRWASIVAGVAFAFSAFRFEHYSHLELEITFWMPLALLWLHRTLESRRPKDAAVTGLLVSLQALSSLYFGLFLIVMMVVVWGVTAFGGHAAPRRGDGRIDWRALFAPWAAAGLVVAVLVLPVTVPYLQNRPQTGDRPSSEARHYSATPRSYLVASSRSIVYGGWLDGPRQPELSLFPGLVIVALAAAGAWPKLDARRGAYLVAALVLFEGSLGANGLVFQTLRAWVLPFRGLRVPARFTVLLGLSIAVLAGFGVLRLRRLAERHSRLASAVPAVCAALLLIENLPRLDLVLLATAPPPVYDYFRGAPPAALVDLPFPKSLVAATRDARFLYFSTFHWQRLLTGSSGYFPESFRDATVVLKGFPTDPGMAYLQWRGVQFIAVARVMCEEGGYETMTARLDTDSRVALVKRIAAPGQEGSIYRLLRSP
jgi:hypothetical protein